MVDILLSRLHIYEERTGKYLSHFKHYVDDVRIILDIGCGRGAFSKALARQRHLVIALDIESKLLREVEDLYIKKVCADSHHFPISDDSVDCILAISLLEHLKDPAECVEELLAHSALSMTLQTLRKS